MILLLQQIIKERYNMHTHTNYTKEHTTQCIIKEI